MSLASEKESADYYCLGAYTQSVKSALDRLNKRLEYLDPDVQVEEAIKILKLVSDECELPENRIKKYRKAMGVE